VLSQLGPRISGNGGVVAFVGEQRDREYFLSSLTLRVVEHAEEIEVGMWMRQEKSVFNGRGWSPSGEEPKSEYQVAWRFEKPSTQTIPEPSSAIALGVLGAGLVASRRRRRSKYT